MSEISVAPDNSAFELPIDAWTKPFWDAAAQRQLLVPRCSHCQNYRWPPGPFCPRCHSQLTEWMPAGDARVYTFTIVRGRHKEEAGAPPIVPALVEFPEAGGVRIPAAIVDTPLSSIQIGAELMLDWAPAANALVPVFKIT